MPRKAASKSTTASPAAPHKPTGKRRTSKKQNGAGGVGGGATTTTAPSRPPRRAPDIEIRNARTNNLRGIDVDIPHGAMTVVTGVSGSGKSSLAFDTLYAEGQRRFVQSLSTYARQFVEKLRRPDVDLIDNIPPAIAIEQRNHVRNARSTVGTASEVNDYLRLLYARASDVVCPQCGCIVTERTAQTLARELGALPEGTRVTIAAPVRLAQPDLAESLRRSLAQMGFTRVWWRGAARELEDLSLDELAAYETWEPVVDRLVVRANDTETMGRLLAATQTAFRIGKNELAVRASAPGDDASAAAPAERRLFQGLRCETCGRAFVRAEPDLFSFYSPLGACKKCEGYGRIVGIDWSKVFPDPTLSLADGAIAPMRTETYTDLRGEFFAFCRKLKISTTAPWRSLPKEQQRLVREGQGEFWGMRGFFSWLESQTHKVQARVLLARYRSYEPCTECGGARLTPEALVHRVGGRTIHDFATMPIGALRAWWEAWEFPDPARAHTARRLLVELRARLAYLDEVGLGYLTLDRQTRTLSGGEAQRINLAGALGSALTETLYVLDEPTVGLHARDTQRLLAILHRLRDHGNTVVVVEHDKEVVKGADRVVDIGPRAGELGGRLVFSGTVAALLADASSATGEFLRRERTARLRPTAALRKPRAWLTVRGARANNLRGIDVAFPTGVLCCVTGVSGSGKTTLVRDILYAAWRRDVLREPGEPPGDHDALVGASAISEMVFVDQTPLGRSARSNPVTYVGAYNEIRQLMAATHDARRLGVTPGAFSFNIPGGRCDVCEGTGAQTIDLHFLGEVDVECDACRGKRFKDHILSIRHDGRNVDDILQLTIHEGMEFFAREDKVREAMRPLVDVGLGYLRLGQSTSTLSGGEIQRLKLATYLGASALENAGGRMLIFDEPSTGLHPADLDTLLGVFDRLVDRGVSILVIEHNLDLVARADWVIDLGPEGGDGGGRLLYGGPPGGLFEHPESHTGRFLSSIVEQAATPGTANGAPPLPPAPAPAPARRVRRSVRT